MPIEAGRRRYLERIAQALQAATDVAKHYAGGTYQVRDNGGRDVVTQVDREVSDVLRHHLLRAGEGWLSEEDHDDKARLSCDVVWTVDPLDGTREFVDGIPEYCISVGLVAEGVAVAGGVCNPATEELFLGTLDGGMTYNGAPAHVSSRTCLDGSVVLASRQEYQRGEWKRFAQDRFTVRPVGSVAYKLALVAAGLADATWTLSPKHEWDVAGGVALVASAGGVVGCPDNTGLRLNRPVTLLPGLVASGKSLWPEIAHLIACRTQITLREL